VWQRNVSPEINVFSADVHFIFLASFVYDICVLHLKKCFSIIFFEVLFFEVLLDNLV
jgi:hypothetical protein